MTLLARRMEPICHNGGCGTGHNSYVYQGVRDPCCKNVKRRCCCTQRRQREVRDFSNGISTTFTRMGRINWEGDHVSRWELKDFLKKDCKSNEKERTGASATLWCRCCFSNDLRKFRVHLPLPWRQPRAQRSPVDVSWNKELPAKPSSPTLRNGCGTCAF